MCLSVKKKPLGGSQYFSLIIHSKKVRKCFKKNQDSNLIGVRIVLSYAHFFSLSFTFALCYFFTIKFIESTVTKRHGHNRK